MKKLTIPSWVFVILFYAIIIAAYFVLDHFLGFDNSPWLTR